MSAGHDPRDHIGLDAPERGKAECFVENLAGLAHPGDIA
jgi:hypothetical protein